MTFRSGEAFTLDAQNSVSGAWTKISDNTAKLGIKVYGVLFASGSSATTWTTDAGDIDASGSIAGSKTVQFRCRGELR